MDLGTNETKVLQFLQESSRHSLEESEIKIPGLGSREISAAVSWLEVKGLAKTVKNEVKSWKLGQEGKKYLDNGLPELRAFHLLEERKSIMVRELMSLLSPSEGKIALAQLAKFGIKPKDGTLSYPKDAGEILDKISERQSALSRVESGDLSDEILSNFRGRETLLAELRRTTRSVQLTDDGRNTAVSEVSGDLIDEVTSEVIASRAWEKKTFRRYDLNAPVERTFSAYYHPLGSLIRRIREIFLRMGFTEMSGHYVEYAGWNMDALFIPQDHPARDMQDTFYLDSRKKPPFEHEEALNIFSKVHEDGIPDYIGWGYKYDKKESKRLMLRTHTTVSTIRYLYEHKDAPQAMFSVEKVFRHESVDWKHLAELHQVEGAVYSKDASLSTLKWLIREFYSQLGFTDLELIPSYYPYTEPSMDVVARIDGKELELGGSGVFRPEVTKAIGLKHPVIAWGLGLERLAMTLFGLNDIREIYSSDLEWLRNFKALY